MERRTVQLQVAGQSYRVVSSAPEEDLHRLAEVVNMKVSESASLGRAAPQAMFLAAMALAHDLQEERSRRESLERRTRDLLRRVLLRIDDALEPFEDDESASVE